MVLNSPRICFTTNCVSMNMSITDTFKWRANLRPDMSPSYPDSLLVVGNMNFTTCLTTKPSGLARMTPAPPACEVDEPYMNKVYSLSSWLKIISPGSELENVHYVMKSSSARDFIVFLG